MKTSNNCIVSILFFLLSVISINAQYGYGSGYGYGYGRYGYGRGRSALPQTNIPDKEPEPKTAEEIVEGEMPKITEALELNEFERAVVSSILIKSIKRRRELQILELDRENALKALKKIYEDQDNELKSGLTEDKYNAFVKLQEEGFKKSKKAKKKKKKKKDKT